MVNQLRILLIGDGKMRKKSAVQRLRQTLLANATFTVLCALALLFFSAPLAALIGVVTHIHLFLVGGGLMLFAADLIRTARGNTIPRARIYYFIMMDVLWVMGSAVLLWGTSLAFTEAGRWIILGIADAVGLFAVFQVIGIWRLRGENRAERQVFIS